MEWHLIKVKYWIRGARGADGYTLKSRRVYVDHTRKPNPGERALMFYYMDARAGYDTIIGIFKGIDGHGCSVVVTDGGHKFRQKTDSIWPVMDEEPEKK